MHRLIGTVVILTSLCAQSSTTARISTQALKDITTKIIIQQESDPIYYSDEPRSALQRVVVQRCDDLLVQLKLQPLDWAQVREQVQGVEESLDELHRLRYDLILPEQEPSHLNINYFSSGF